MKINMKNFRPEKHECFQIWKKNNHCLLPFSVKQSSFKISIWRVSNGLDNLATWRSSFHPNTTYQTTHQNTTYTYKMTFPSQLPTFYCTFQNHYGRVILNAKELRHLVALHHKSGAHRNDFRGRGEEVQAEERYAYGNCGSGRLGQAQDIHSSLLHDA